MDPIVCPLDFRYGREKVKRIFSEEGRLRAVIRVEAALAAANAEVGRVPKDAAEAIARVAEEGSVTTDRVNEIEAEINHDLMAIVKAMAEQAGDAGGYIHMGATSYDIVDTALGLLFKAYVQELRSGIVELSQVLSDLAVEHRDTPMIGRTHAQHAVPMTFGLKMAVFTAEMLRHHDRLNELEDRLCVGKMSGAVGTGAGHGGKGADIERVVMESLGLGAEEAATQIVQRDRYVELVNYLANLSTSLEKFATEIRNLQRSEIDEARESFDEKKQVGSSTMAQKKNPILAENICGLTRVVRGFAVPQMESAIQWHERDLANSSAERFIIPHACIITDFALHRTIKLFRLLDVNVDRMAENLMITGGRMMAEACIIALTERGVGRQSSHELVRQCSLGSQASDITFRDALLANEVIASAISAEELDGVMDPANYLGRSGEIVDDIVARARSLQD